MSAQRLPWYVRHLVAMNHGRRGRIVHAGLVLAFVPIAVWISSLYPAALATLVVGAAWVAAGVVTAYLLFFATVDYLVGAYIRRQQAAGRDGDDPTKEDLPETLAPVVDLAAYRTARTQRRRAA